ncbi:uroporphyrinogen-III C-methyltransferase [Halomonas salifodinae]|uniref:uroporphyrinogen-III C-methyltransferase n=1 Tax=Halomonas salifodinae TaxID=438745 RepID=UPI0033B3E26F
MSKQPHDQDERPAPGAASQEPADQASGAAEQEKGNRSGRRRRGGQGQSASTKAGAAASAPASGESEASSDKAGTSAPGKSTSSKPASGGKSASQGSAAAGKPGSAKQGTGKAAAGGGGQGGNPPTQGQGRGGKAGLIALVLVVLLALVGLWLGWMGWQALDEQRERLAAAEAEVAALQSLNDLEARLESRADESRAALDSALSGLEGDFRDYRGEVDEALDRVLAELAREQNADEREWLHAEAAYLLRLANQRVQLERDPEGAAALLRTADARLSEADNPALLPVRRALASELAALEAVPRVDRTGLYLALDAQQQQLATLPLAQDVEELALEIGNGGAPTGGWREQLGRFAGELTSLVTVRHHDQALEALIAPEQEAYLRQNVRLLLEQAQLALLKEEEALYRASLDKAITLVEGYYATDRDGVQNTLARLAELRERAIRPELPDISGSQQALNRFIDSRFGGAGEAGES